MNTSSYFTGVLPNGEEIQREITPALMRAAVKIDRRFEGPMFELLQKEAEAKTAASKALIGYEIKRLGEKRRAAFNDLIISGC